MEPLRPPLCLTLAVPVLALALFTATSESALAAPNPPITSPTFVDFDTPPVSPVEPTQQVHIVGPGETIKLIAAWYGTDVMLLAKANGLANPDLIHPGQRLIIPGTTAAAAPAPAPEQEPLAASVSIADPLEPTVGNIQAYIIAVFAPLGRAAQEWALRVAECESRFNPYAVNHGGDWHGLFQYHPTTWAQLTAADIYDWQEQVRVTAHLYALGQQWRWRCR